MIRGGEGGRPSDLEEQLPGSMSAGYTCPTDSSCSLLTVSPYALLLPLRAGGHVPAHKQPFEPYLVTRRHSLLPSRFPRDVNSSLFFRHPSRQAALFRSRSRKRIRKESFIFARWIMADRFCAANLKIFSLKVYIIVSLRDWKSSSNSFMSPMNSISKWMEVEI